MARRNIPPHHLLRPHPTQIAELSALQHRQIHALLVDNQRLAAIHVALKQELSLAHQQLRHLSTTLSTINLESDAQFREVFDKAVQLETEVRVVGEFSVELGKVMEDVGKMEEDRKEMVGKLEDIKAQVRNVREEVGKGEEVREGVEVLRREVLKARAAVEYEKKMHATNFEIGQILEENMVSIAREIEKVRAELANAEKMARAAAAAAASPGPAYAAGYRKSDVGYTVNSYAGPYAAQQFQGNVDSGSRYSSGAPAHSPYGTQQNRVP